MARSSVHTEDGKDSPTGSSTWRSTPLVETAVVSSAAVLGPVIGPCCYEFGRDDLARSRAGVHASPAAIAGTTLDGTAALDVPAAVRSALDHHAIDLDAVGPCTGCDDRWFSHRVRADLGRHATVASIGREDRVNHHAADEVARRLDALRIRIDAVERPWTHGVEVTAVTKAFAPTVIDAAVEAGCTVIGENYAQDLLSKRPTIELIDPQRRPRVDFIGHLQSNKVRQLVGFVDRWCTIDRARSPRRSPSVRREPRC